MGRELYATSKAHERVKFGARDADPSITHRYAFSNIRGSVTESKGTVLVVDDEEAILQVASDILSYLGYSVETSPSGQEAVDRLLQGARPDLVLLDVIMPGMGGVETFRKLREIQPDLPILISTGYAERSAVQSLADEGVAGFVNKPFAIEALAKRLEQILG